MGLFLWSLVSVVIAVLIVLPFNGQFVFDPKELQAIAKAAIAKTSSQNGTTQNLVDHVIAGLRVKYGQHILEKPEWMFNNAGGAMGSMIVLHCSLSEYVIIFGTAVGTEGHTGRFFADDYFTIIHGEQWAFSAGELEKEVYKPGDQHHLRYLESKQYRMPDSCWALEYARGNIPSMMPFGLFDTFFSTLDLHTLYKTIKVSAQGMTLELLRGKI